MIDEQSEFKRGWNAGLKMATSLLDTDEALTGASHKAIKIALNAMRMPPVKEGVVSESTPSTPEKP